MLEPPTTTAGNGMPNPHECSVAGAGDGEEGDEEAADDDEGAPAAHGSKASRWLLSEPHGCLGAHLTAGTVATRPGHQCLRVRLSCSAYTGQTSILLMCTPQARAQVASEAAPGPAGRARPGGGLPASGDAGAHVERSGRPPAGQQGQVRRWEIGFACR
jgi:hypothetical protein